MGAVGFGLETYEPIEGVIARLVQRGVRMTGDIIRFEAGNTVSFEDPDGTPTYLHEFPPEMVPETDLEAGQASTEEDRVGHAVRRTRHRLRLRDGCRRALLHQGSRAQPDEPLRR